MTPETRFMLDRVMRKYWAGIPFWRAIAEVKTGRFRA